MSGDCGVLCGRVAVVGIAATAGVPSLIFEIVVSHLSGGVLEAGPWTYYVQPDTPGADIPRRAAPNIRFAPSWPEVWERAVELIGDRPVLAYDRASIEVLRAHAPDWEPAGVLVARDLAAQTWPGMGTALWSDRSGAAAQVAAVTALVPALLRANPPQTPPGPAGPGPGRAGVERPEAVVSHTLTGG